MFSNISTGIRVCPLLCLLTMLPLQLLYAGLLDSTEVELDYDGGVTAGVDKVDTIWRIKPGCQW